MATKCDPIRTQLHDLEEQLRKTPMFLTDPAQGENRQAKPVLNSAWTNLDSHIKRTRMALRACEGTD